MYEHCQWTKFLLKQEYLTSKHAWFKLEYNNFCEFLQRLFLKLDDYGSLVDTDNFGGRLTQTDDFATIRLFTISLLNVLVFG